MFNRNMNLDNLDKDILLKNKIPLLYSEPSWTKLFGNVDNKKIENAKEELMELVSREKELEIQNKELQKQKLRSMKMILGISDSVNNESKVENIGLLDEYKEQILQINQALDELTFQLETIPKEIRESNLQLLKATIEYSYSELKIREKFVKEANSEIETLRARLKILIDTKHNYEEWINETYTFLHGVLGSEEIEKIDKERLK
ncbi:hypothetical protein KQI41_13590 [Tissierella pigra]|uniref:Uncharacterized protein n=1 Tax=Tissierella pigra TaxID=2607614 RepID=A0A6N7XWN5_9FIRM|nr:hypothetical protein [Tissierella pigra]MBU5427419.1 hypothetical protein [Tissierella pigra]MSU00964.1 hypothetical protein [Tissierella pigra]